VIGATRPVADFVDTLSNWYVRQSRRRFWDGDAQALDTLHHVLVTVSQLLAPTVPFIAEEIYQNLVTNALPGGADSVHLSRWPQVDPALIDEQLSADMALVQKVTSLGHAARQLANLKVRQPLAQVVVRARKPGEKESLLRHQALLLAELNVKALAFAEGADDLVDVQVHPLPKQLGQKFGSGFPKIRKALEALDQTELAASFQFGETVQVEADGQVYAIEPGDVEVRSTPRSGFSVAEDGGYLVAITTEITQELADEGNAREMVRRIQQLRKDAGLDISDRIVIHVTTSPALRRLLHGFGGYVREETLAVDLHQLQAEQDEQIPDHLPQTQFDLDNEMVTVAIAKK
jgi:isoleucyl-tRNA synthetase